jgi:hypothetical protein
VALARSVYWLEGSRTSSLSGLISSNHNMKSCSVAEGTHPAQPAVCSQVALESMVFVADS